MRKRLLYHPERYSTIRSAAHLEKLFDEYFVRAPIDFAQTYDPATDIIVVPCMEYKTDNWVNRYINQGFKIVVEYMWDNDITVTSQATDQILTLKSANWIWFNEALWYIALGYDKIKITSTQDKFFLSTMRLTRPHRDEILKQVEPYLADSLYSYTSKGIMLPNDKIIDGDVEQRYINPAWFTSTTFSLVSEASTRYPTFISEKTFKPIAFQHPFVVWGSPETLKYLHTAGFETFGHIIDESYDTMFNNIDRLNAIVGQLDQMYVDFKRGKLFTDSVTKEKLEHNRNHFYNNELLVKMFNDEIIKPLLEFTK